MKAKKAGEKNLEARLRNAGKKLGCIVLKFASSYNTGWPDRFIISSWGRLYLAEVKTEGQELTPKQKSRVARARKMGFTVFIINSNHSLTQAVNQLKNDYEIYG